MNHTHILGADLYQSWLGNLQSGTPPERFALGEGPIGDIDLGPGRILLIGGPPGAGKTAFVMQGVIDALRMDPNLRALVANVEMPAEVLLDRQLARISGIPLTTIRNRSLSPELADRLEQALASLKPAIERMAFLTHPFDLGRVALAADEFGARLLVLDYIQRFASGGDGGNDRRGSIDSVMSTLRAFASDSRAVIAVSAVSRTRDTRGRASYAASGLNLASFRESSEIEFGADDAYILAVDESWKDLVRLKHLKSRYGETRDLLLRFERGIQRFVPIVGDEAANASPQVAQAWNDADLEEPEVAA